jgi:hypothetical protein
MYLVQLLDYLDYEDCITKLFIYIIIALEICCHVYHLNAEALRDPQLWVWEGLYDFS